MSDTPTLRALIEREIAQQESYARSETPCADVWKDRPGPEGHAHTASVLRRILQAHDLKALLSPAGADAGSRTVNPTEASDDGLPRDGASLARQRDVVPSHAADISGHPLIAVMAVVAEWRRFLNDKRRTSDGWRRISVLLDQIEWAALLSPAGARPQETDVLAAPCRWCGYNGPGYWQAGSHAWGCPWYCISGVETRRQYLPLAFPAEARVPSERPHEENDDDHARSPSLDSASATGSPRKPQPEGSELDLLVADYKRIADSHGEHRLKDVIWLVNELIYERDHARKCHAETREG